jgi:hypothetical protein
MKAAACARGRCQSNLVRAARGFSLQAARGAAPDGAPAGSIGERLNRWPSFPEIELKAQSMSDFLDASLVSNRIAR